MQRYEQFSEMSNELQNLQRVRDPMNGSDAEGKRPTIADLRESGASSRTQTRYGFCTGSARSRQMKQHTAELSAKNGNGGKVDLLFRNLSFLESREKIQGLIKESHADCGLPGNTIARPSTDKATRGDHRCGLYIMQQVKEKTEPEGQEELF